MRILNLQPARNVANANSQAQYYDYKVLPTNVTTPVTAAPQQPSPLPNGPLSNKAKMLCNCCNCSTDGCAQSWAIFNLIQVYLCYVLIPIRHLIWTATNAIIKNPKERKEECLELYRVAGSPPTNITLSVEMILLFLYTIGSILFAAAVFHKTLGPKQRSMLLLIYIILLASLPLAYLIPLIIRFTFCTKAGFGSLIYVGAWFLTVIGTTICGANVAWVLRKWVMAMAKDNNQSIPTTLSQSQPQIQGSTTTTSTSDNQVGDGDNQETN